MPWLVKMMPLSEELSPSATLSGGQSFTGGTTTASLPLRRAIYVRVADLVRAFNIEPDKLKVGMAKVEAADTVQEDGKAESDDIDDVAERENVDPTERAELDISGGRVTRDDEATRSLSLAGLSVDDKNVGPEERQGSHKPFQQRLVPPSGGSNLCL